MTDSFRATRHFHHGRFHQDWGEEYDDARDVIDDFLISSPRAQALRDEARAILARGMDEAELELFFRKNIDSEFVPELDGFTWRSFLEWIIDRSAEVHRGGNPGARTP